MNVINRKSINICTLHQSLLIFASKLTLLLLRISLGINVRNGVFVSLCENSESVFVIAQCTTAILLKPDIIEIHIKLRYCSSLIDCVFPAACSVKNGALMPPNSHMFLAQLFLMNVPWQLGGRPHFEGKDYVIKKTETQYLKSE